MQKQGLKIKKVTILEKNSEEMEMQSSRTQREAVTTYFLSLLDLMQTHYMLSIGVEELNPLFQNMPWAIFYKVIIVGLLLLFLASRTEPIAKWGIRLCMGVYIGINIWHMVGAVMIHTLG